MADNNSDQPPPAEPPVSSRQRAELRISGHVQGVYYRSAATEQARVLGLRGVVRNLLGGDVELIAEGPPAELQQLIDWCHLGPPAARVDKVTVSFADPTDEFVDFRVVRSPR